MFSAAEFREAQRIAFPNRPIFCTPEMLSQLAFPVPEEYRKQLFILDFKEEGEDDTES